jgi:hypothetical protein
MCCFLGSFPPHFLLNIKIRSSCSRKKIARVTEYREKRNGHDSLFGTELEY